LREKCEQSVNLLEKDEIDSDRFRLIYSIPEFLIIPDLPWVEKIASGKWSLDIRDPTTSDFCYVDEWYYNNLGSYFDWVEIYIEDDFCDNVGACIFINCNSKSELYNRILVYESFDEAVFTLLKEEITLDRVTSIVEGFKPVKCDGDECLADKYFVSFLVKHYT